MNNQYNIRLSIQNPLSMNGKALEAYNNMIALAHETHDETTKSINQYGIIEHTNNSAVSDTIRRNTNNYSMPYEDTSDYSTIKSVNHYTNKRDFVAGEYINIAKSVCNSLRFMRKKDKDGNTTLVATDCYETITEIIQKGYNDCLFEDITQEIAIYLLANIDSWKMIIVNYENGKVIYKFSDYKIYKALCNLTYRYMYNQKIKRDNVECNDMYIFCGYIEDEETHEQKANYTQVAQAVNAKEYRDYIYKESQRTVTSDEQTHIAIIKDCIIDQLRKQGVKPFIVDKCYQVLNLMRYGFDNKKISEKSGISINSVAKYKRLIKEAFSSYKDFQKARLHKEYKFAGYDTITSKHCFTYIRKKAPKINTKPIKSRQVLVNPFDTYVMQGWDIKTDKNNKAYETVYNRYSKDYNNRLAYYVETQR